MKRLETNDLLKIEGGCFFAIPKLFLAGAPGNQGALPGAILDVVICWNDTE